MIKFCIAWVVIIFLICSFGAESVSCTNDHTKKQTTMISIDDTDARAHTYSRTHSNAQAGECADVTTRSDKAMDGAQFNEIIVFSWDNLLKIIFVVGLYCLLS